MTVKKSAKDYAEYWEDMDSERAGIIKACLSRIEELEVALKYALAISDWGDNQDAQERLHKMLEAEE